MKTAAQPVPSAPASRPGFGTQLAGIMAVAQYRDGRWHQEELLPAGPLPIHPAAHVLHYASTCFEGFKAYRWADGSINVFRMDSHIARMQHSAKSLVLPVPDPKQLANMVFATINRNRSEVPEVPGALYLRPILIGTTENIGAASIPSTEATLIVLASPVWDYFAGGMRALRIFVDDVNTRSAAHTGRVKTGGNYAAAMAPTLEARRLYNSDQVLFAPGGELQETGAANFILIRKGHLLTKNLDSTILHGVTRDSLLTLARSKGYQVEERAVKVPELLEWAATGGEAALSGTAAVLASVGTLIYHGKDYPVGTGDVGAVTKELRSNLVSIQEGRAPDPFGWCQKVPKA